MNFSTPVPQKELDILTSAYNSNNFTLFEQKFNEIFQSEFQVVAKHIDKQLTYNATGDTLGYVNQVMEDGAGILNNSRNIAHSLDYFIDDLDFCISSTKEVFVSTATNIDTCTDNLMVLDKKEKLYRTLLDYVHSHPNFIQRRTFAYTDEIRTCITDLMTVIGRQVVQLEEIQKQSMAMMNKISKIRSAALDNKRTSDD